MAHEDLKKTTPEEKSFRNPHRHKWASAYPPIVANRSPRFVAFSIALHTALAAGVIYLSARALSEPKMETVTIELTDSVGPVAIADGQAGPDTEGAAGAPTGSVTTPVPTPTTTPPEPAKPVVAEKESADKEDIVAPQAAPAPEPVKTTKLPPPPPPTKPAVKEVKPQPVAKPSPFVKAPVAASPAKPMPPATLDDLDAPELDEPQPPIATVTKDMDDSDLSDGFSKVDEQHAQKTTALQQEMDQDKQAMDDDEAVAAAELAAENDRQQAALAAAAAARKAHSEKIAKEAAEAQAKAAAAKAEKEKAAALAAATAQAGKTTQQGEGSGTGAEGAGSGSSGEKIAGPAAGVAGGVRTIDQLRQMPGNPRPSYTEEERAAQQQGDVVFMAYVGRDGLPSQFKQTRSTGYGNLDSKTLDALKRWKFYPGQEGWVEIPIRWDLRGGPQESSALGRRKLSQKPAETSSF
ncbi:MAG: TonB family protein [Bdellovibrionaceae bacterium]|nr:TonB family protein [Pseudobdellovibrionaceae bacterium]